MYRHMPYLKFVFRGILSFLHCQSVAGLAFLQFRGISMQTLNVFMMLFSLLVGIKEYDEAWGEV